MVASFAALVILMVASLGGVPAVKRDGSALVPRVYERPRHQAGSFESLTGSGSQIR